MLLLATFTFLSINFLLLSLLFALKKRLDSTPKRPKKLLKPKKLHKKIVSATIIFNVGEQIALLLIPVMNSILSSASLEKGVGESIVIGSTQPERIKLDSLPE